VFIEQIALFIATIIFLQPPPQLEGVAW